MHRRRPSVRARGAAAVLAAVLAVALVGPTQASGQEEPAGTDSATVAELEEVSVAERLALEELAVIDQRIAALDIQLSTVGQQVSAAQAAVVAAESTLARTAAAEEQAGARLAAEEERLVARAVTLYVSGRSPTDASSFALDATDASDALAGMAYGNAVIDSTQDLVARRERAELAAERASSAADEARVVVVTQRDELQSQLDALGAARTEVTGARERQQQLADQLQARRATIEAQLLAFDGESDSIGQFLAALQADQELLLPPFTFPVPSAAGFGSAFGPRMHPILGYVRLHKGADIGCRSGTPIVAAAAGTVVVAAGRGGYGNTVVIDHGGKTATLYAHNSQLLVGEGDVVAIGQQIATCGSTGLSTGPHSHFELRLAGVPTDPAAVVPPPGTAAATSPGG